jgi:hypothetical protein
VHPSPDPTSFSCRNSTGLGQFGQLILRHFSGWPTTNTVVDKMATTEKSSLLKRLNDKLGLKLNLPTLLLMFKYVKAFFSSMI